MTAPESNSLLQQALLYIDEANSADPNLDTDETGTSVAKELLYGQRMSTALSQLYPNASEHLQIAARAQHMERWKSLRSDYPEGRTGYKKWRAELGLFHATRAAECMTQAGYGTEECARVKYLVQKRQIKRDEETQALEDCACIVFLSFYLNAFIIKHNDDKLIDIIQKTWAKMSDHGHAAALKLNFSPKAQELIERALA